MDIVTVLLFCLMSLIIGAVLILLIQYYAYIRYFNFPEEYIEQKSINEKYSLPDSIANDLKSTSSESKYPIIGINLIMQFLFHELKYSSKVRKWFYRKLSVELDELITKTTTGKLFDKLMIRDLDLGGQFPEIKDLRVHNAELHDEEGHIENLDLLLDIQYKGNFRVSIDADMVLGKKGSLTLKVKNLSGLARLQFTRKPYTHWSLSFLGDPQLDLHIESQFQGRQMQSNITSLILQQIRKAVRRKHTLPNYKLRYKPFFHHVEDEFDPDVIPDGRLQMKVSELSRLNYPNHIDDIYCTLTLASVPWVEARQKDDRNIIASIDVEIHKAKNQQIGIVFKQEENNVIIEAVLHNTPAVKANLKSGDILISIEGKKMNTINQVAKIIKSLNKPIFSLRIERVFPGIIRNDAILEDLDSYEDFTDLNISFTKSTESVQMVGSSATSVGSSSAVASTAKLTRRSSTEKGTSSESSLCNTPTNSPRKMQTITKAFSKAIKEEANAATAAANTGTSGTTAENIGSGTTDGSSANSSRQNSTGIKSKSSSLTAIKDGTPHFPQHSTIDCPVSSYIHMEDLCNFTLDENSTYINVCVYGKIGGDRILLGYINIPVNAILGECSESSLGNILKIYNLMPPNVPELQNHPLSTQSGFNPNLCFGDILLGFVWSGNIIPSNDISKKPKLTRDISGKLEIDTDRNDTTNTKSHNFIRTHFHRTTQCDFCGKKIWLKDAVQCRDCSMCCHKKCITKCQNSTVCGPVDINLSTSTTSINQSTTTTTTSNTISSQPPPYLTSSSSSTTTLPSINNNNYCNQSSISCQPEFTVTEAPTAGDNCDNVEELDEPKGKLDSHRQSFSDLLVQGLKRVNSANNLAIPGVISARNQSSRSLPPSPQHTPRKQSLVNQSTNPFIIITQKLETIPNSIDELTKEQINGITEPIIGTKIDDIMSLAKSSSKGLYSEMEPNERVEKINNLLSKLRIALDSETASHATLVTGENLNSTPVKNVSSSVQSDRKSDSVQASSDISSSLQTISESSGSNLKDQSNQQQQQQQQQQHQQQQSQRDKQRESEHKAILISQSEERVQALSVIMLYLCTGLQHAQGVVSQ